MQITTEVWRGQVRMPKPIAEWLQGQAQKNFRSINAQIVQLLNEAKTNAEQNAAQ